MPDLVQTRPLTASAVLSFTAVSFAFFFVTGATFASLGVVLWSMGAAFGWTAAEAGASFSLLGLACGLSSPLPAAAIRRIGVRATVAAGAAMLAAGCALAAVTGGLLTFFGAIVLMGIAFSLLAPVPGVSLLPRLFGANGPRAIGFYYTVGAAGGVLGPLLVAASVRLTGSWRLHWALLATLSLALAAALFLAIRDPAGAGAAPIASRSTAGPAARAAMRTYPFAATAFAMLAIQTALTVSNGVLVAHTARLGGSTAAGAEALALFGLLATAAKAAGGLAAGRVAPLFMLMGGLGLDAAGLFLVGTAHGPGAVQVGAAVTGAGWGVAWLGANLLLLERFGAALAPDLVASATLVSTAAVLAPFGAGLLADRVGSTAPMFLLVAAFCVAALLSSLGLRRRAAAGRLADGLR